GSASLHRVGSRSDPEGRRRSAHLRPACTACAARREHTAHTGTAQGSRGREAHRTRS
ncbi:60S ribosomal protein L18, partial [Aphelenchoides avenae]